MRLLFILLMLTLTPPANAETSAHEDSDEMEIAFFAHKTSKIFTKIKFCYEKQLHSGGKRLDDDCRDTLMFHDLLGYEKAD